MPEAVYDYCQNKVNKHVGDDEYIPEDKFRRHWQK